MNMMTTMGLPPIAPPDPASMRRALLGASNLAAADRHLKLRRLFAAFDRNDMEAGVELLLTALDAMDGDPDVEENGDETDHTNGEDEGLHEHAPCHLSGPGCAISDPGEPVGDELDTDDAEDAHGRTGGSVTRIGAAPPGCEISDAGGPAWTEWHTRGRHKLNRWGSEAREDGPDPNEDLEANGDELDAAWAEQGAGQYRTTMSIGDPTVGEDDEPEDDCCLAGDDMVQSGPFEHRGLWITRNVPSGWEIGDEADAERGRQPAETPVAANEAWA